MLFPRSHVRAACESMVRVACLHHDQRLSGDDFHLFRLPTHLEEALSAWWLSTDAALDWPPDDEAAIIAELGGARAVTALAGPSQIKQNSRSDFGATLTEIRARYASSPSGEAPTIPYFSGL